MIHGSSGYFTRDWEHSSNREQVFEKQLILIKKSLHETFTGKVSASDTEMFGKEFEQYLDRETLEILTN